LGLHDQQMTAMRVLQGDITTLAVDAIVNAANEALLGGGGVDGAIHRAAGPELLSACRAHTEVRPQVRCPTGEARITPGFLLAAKYVIHTVGPVWEGGSKREDELLAACYRSSLALAANHALSSLAFPAVSCGVYRFPPERAARIAVREVTAHLASATSVAQVTFVAFNQAIADVLRTALQQSGQATAGEE
jgi:O-acetyl-ADP-ribose deacetylase (regulator of RNase III)